MVHKMNTTYLEKLGYTDVLKQLSKLAVSEKVKSKCLALTPASNYSTILYQMAETTEAKQMMERLGTPPVPVMADLENILAAALTGVMLTPGQLQQVLQFLTAVQRMKRYLKKGEDFEYNLSLVGRSFMDCDGLQEQLEKAVIHERVQDGASTHLASIRGQLIKSEEQIKKRMDELLKKNKPYLAESYVTIKNGCYTLPVKKAHKNRVPGQIIEISSRGSTLFIEPAAIGKWQQKHTQLLIEEENEVRIILYALTDMVAGYEKELGLCRETMESLDFAFAKGKMSMDMKAGPVVVTQEKVLSICEARHPAIPEEEVVPLNFYADEKNRGVIITGPNTGGKTVTLKTVGLLALMAQSGFHVPAKPESCFPVFSNVLCDLGDGQSITESLSTFSAHMTNIIEILKNVREDSLILLDELGSGTDPSEGMGLALSIVEELAQENCLFIVTTHYPQLKDYASNRQGIQNARMAFDKENLKPLYRLEIGTGGDSCAYYIARKIGLPAHILERAQSVSDAGENKEGRLCFAPMADQIKNRHNQKKKKLPQEKKLQGPGFQRGDSVLLHPDKTIAIVYQPADEKGQVGIQLKGEKMLVNWKRLSLHVKAEELYPQDYDFSVIFDSVQVRKARKIMTKRHEEGNEITIE